MTPNPKNHIAPLAGAIFLIFLAGCTSTNVSTRLIHSNDLNYAEKDRLDAIAAIARKDTGSATALLVDQGKHIAAHDNWSGQVWVEFQNALAYLKEVNSWWFGPRSWRLIEFCEWFFPTVFVGLAVANYFTGGAIYNFLAPLVAKFFKVLLLHKGSTS